MYVGSPFLDTVCPEGILRNKSLRNFSPSLQGIFRKLCMNKLQHILILHHICYERCDCVCGGGGMSDGLHVPFYHSVVLSIEKYMYNTFFI